MQTRFIVGVLAAGFVLCLTPQASAQTGSIDACVHKAQGKVRIVAAGEACQAAEVKVVWPASSSGSGSQSAGALWVMDSSTPPQEVGYLVDIFHVILAPHGEEDLWHLAFNTNGFTAFSGMQIFYASSDCTGQGYAPAGSPNLPVTIGHRAGDDVFYLTGPVLPTFEFSSSKVAGGNQCGGNPGPPFNVLGNVAAVGSRPLTDFTVRGGGPLTAPFRVVRR